VIGTPASENTLPVASMTCDRIAEATVLDATTPPSTMAETWAERICVASVETVESVIKIGRLLTDAKADLPHGEWSGMFAAKSLPFNRQTAFKFMAIAAHPVVGNVSHGKHLPVKWTALYELSKIEPATLEAAIAAGSVFPNMKRADADALRPKNTQPEQAEDMKAHTALVNYSAARSFAESDRDASLVHARSMRAVASIVLGYEDHVQDLDAPVQFDRLDHTVMPTAIASLKSSHRAMGRFISQLERAQRTDTNGRTPGKAMRPDDHLAVHGDEAADA
jgi:hypothetical protein